MKTITSVATGELQKALRIFSRLVPQRQLSAPTRHANPTSFLSIVCAGRRMTISGTDSVAWLQTTIDLSEPATLSTFVEATRFKDAVCFANETHVQLTFDQTGNRLIIKSGGSIFRLTTYRDQPSFQILPRLQTADVQYSIDGAMLAAGLRKVIYAGETQEAGAAFTGFALNFYGNHADIVVTDGHQLAKVSVAIQARDERNVQAIIDGRYLSIIRELCALGEVDIAFDTTLTVQVENFICHLPVMRGTFPEWTKKLPVKLYSTLKVDRISLANVLARIALFFGDTTHEVHLTAQKGSDSLIIKVQNADSQFEESIEAEVDDFNAVLSHTYLAKTLTAIDSTIVEMRKQEQDSFVIFLDSENLSWIGITMGLKF